MLTQCPSCQTTFRVTSEILRVAHGQVRCGRCQTQFDALERLIEETDDGAVESGRYMRPPRAIPQPPPPPGHIDVEESVEHEDIELEGRHIGISGVYETIDETGQGQLAVHEEVSEEWVEIDEEEQTVDTDPALIDLPDDSAGDEFVDQEDDDIRIAAAEIAEEQAQSQVAQWAEQTTTGRSGRWNAPAASNLTNSRTREPASERSERTRRNQQRIEAAMAEEGSDFGLSAPQRPAQPAATVWKILAVPFVLLLLVQVVHNYRATLARHPTLGAPLQSIYSALGLTLRPDWNLHAYEIKQWGVAADPTVPGTLKVRASVKNLAEFAQPYPQIKLVLEDRWGEQVRAREFEPSEYLDPTTSPSRLLDPAQQTNATINIVDPGPDAEGFRFDVCLPGARGPVCAADVPGKR